MLFRVRGMYFTVFAKIVEEIVTRQIFLGSETHRTCEYVHPYLHRIVGAFDTRQKELFGGGIFVVRE